MRIVHLSDLHFGHHDPRLAEGLAAEISGQTPDIVVVSGDFTQLGSAAEFAVARDFLKTIAVPWFAVPGNHDVPARNLFKRFVDPYGYYRRYISEDLEPFIEIGGVALAGVKTSRRMRLEFNWAHGSISREQLADLERRFEGASPNAVKVVVAHHPLLQPELAGTAPTQRVKRADLALETFAGLGVRLVLSGHFHLSYVREHHHGVAEAQAPGPRESAAAGILVAQAATTISTRLRGEPNAYNLIDIDDGIIAIRVREWTTGGWATRETAAKPA